MVRREYVEEYMARMMEGWREKSRDGPDTFFQD